MNVQRILLPLLWLAVAAGCQGKAELESPGVEPVDYAVVTGEPVTEQGTANARYGPVTGAVTTLGVDGTILVVPNVTPTPTPTPTPTWTKDWFVSPTGSDTANGAQATPFKTINRAMNAVNPGERVVVLAGTYREQLLIDSTRAAGTTARPIMLQGVDKPRILAPGTQALAVVSRANWIIDGFDFDAENKVIPGLVYMGDTAGCVLRNNLIHGGQRSGVVVHAGGNNILIENNQIYGWWHDVNDAHGIIILWTAHHVTVRNNKISGNSGDSVQCEGPEPYGITDPPGDNLMIEGNEFTNNKENAVDIKTCTNVTVRNNWAHDFTTLGGAAFVVHMSAANVLIENNLVENTGRFLSLGGNRSGPMPANVIVRKNKIRTVYATNGMTGIALQVANADRPIIEGNTFINIGAISVSVGDGTGGPTDGMILRNNILTGPRAVRVGAQAPGFVSRNNLIDSASVIGVTTGNVSVTQWQASGVDVGSKTAAGPLCDANFAPITSAVNSGTTSTTPFCGSAPDIGAVETGC